jgi:ATP synthase protein I
MTESGTRAGDRTRVQRWLGTGKRPPDTRTENPGWAAFSYLLSGMIFYGGVGWAIGHWAIHSALFFPLGMVVGLALGVTLVILRYGRTGQS